MSAMSSVGMYKSPTTWGALVYKRIRHRLVLAFERTQSTSLAPGPESPSCSANFWPSAASPLESLKRMSAAGLLQSRAGILLD